MRSGRLCKSSAGYGLTGGAKRQASEETPRRPYEKGRSSMKKIEAVIFDWAGTTVDFGSMAPVQAFIRAFEKFGITPTVQEVRTPMGKLKWDHIHEMLQMPRIHQEWIRVQGRDWTREDVDQVYRVSEEAILEILPAYAQVKPYVPEAVASLRERGIKIGSTTGYTDEMMEIVSEAARKNGYAPDACFTPNSVGDKGRPYPYMIYCNLNFPGSLRFLRSPLCNFLDFLRFL